MSCFKISFHRKWISLLVAWPGVDKKQEGSSAHTQTSHHHGTCSCSCKFCLFDLFCFFFASPQISLQKDNCSLSDAASSKTFSLFPFCSNWPELIRVLVFLTPRFLLNYSQIQLKVFPTTLVFSPLDHCLCCLILIQIASFNIQLQETFCGFLDRVWLQSDGASCLNCFLPLWIPKITFIWTFAACALYVFHSLWFAPLRWLQSWTCCTVEQCKHLVRSPNRTY